jgi:uncharacterized protein
LPKTDFQLLLALIAPLLVWPWVPAGLFSFPENNIFNTVALFTLVPIVEEILFRGFLQGWLLQKIWFGKINAGISRANWFTGIAFASAHLWQHALWLMPGYFLVSLLLGHFRERYQGIRVSILLHAYYNLGFVLVMHNS